MTIGCAEYHVPEPNIGSTASFEEKLVSIDKWLAELADRSGSLGETLMEFVGVFVSH